MECTSHVQLIIRKDLPVWSWEKTRFSKVVAVT
jgi:hypothetical protein